MLTSLAKGIIVGIGASIPLGPLGVLCVQKTLSKGRNCGLITGLGASVSDTFYAAISLLGLAFLQTLDDHLAVNDLSSRYRLVFNSHCE